MFSNNFYEQGAPGAGTLTLTLAYPEVFFGALVNAGCPNSGASTATFFSGSTALLSVALDARGPTSPVPTSIPNS